MMKASRVESMRSIKSNKSMRSMRSLKTLSVPAFEQKETTFEETLLKVCQKYSCQFIVLVKRDYHQDDYYKQLKVPEAPVKYKKITVTTPSGPISQVEVEKLDDKTTGTSPSEISIGEDISRIFITCYYDNVHNLTEIYIANERNVPRSLMQIIGYLAPSYEHLTKITIFRCTIDYYTIYEISKTMATSYVTDVCLDGSPVPEGNYFILLDQTRIKYLSLCRCKINDEVCSEIATRLHFLGPAEKTLLLLNLSSNHITDEGAKCLGQALRTNRHLRYLNLADNRISDDGAGAILDTLIEFLLTYDETMNKRRRRLEYLKARRMYIMKFYDDYEGKSSDEFTFYGRRSLKKKKTSATSIKNKGNFNKDKKKDKANVDASMAKAELFANEFLGPFVDPFSQLHTAEKDGCGYCLGNMVLCYLNLSYNRLSYLSVKKLLAVLEYQKFVKKINQSGLIKVVIEGNRIPISCLEYMKINDLTRLTKSQFLGRSSTSAIRQRSRSTRISLQPGQSSSGRN